MQSEGVKLLTDLPDVQLYRVIDVKNNPTMEDPEILKWISVYNTAIEQLLKARIYTLISKAREANIHISNEKNYNQLYEQGQMHCEYLEKTIKKALRKIKDSLNNMDEITFDQREFYSRKFAKQKGMEIYSQVKKNRQISKERRKRELTNLKKTLIELGIDFKQEEIEERKRLKNESILHDYLKKLDSALSDLSDSELQMILRNVSQYLGQIGYFSDIENEYKTASL